MKRIHSFSIFAGACLAVASFSRPCVAADSFNDTSLYTPENVRSLDPAEEARKIRHLAKIALSNEATASSRQIFSEEIAAVEANKKLKQKVATLLTQTEDDSDPTLPKVTLVKYKDGAVRGLLFTQTDGVRDGKPNRLAWPLDPKREQKEQTR